MQDTEVSVLKNTTDPYNTRYIKSVDLPTTTHEFEKVLKSTLAQFREEKVKGVYLEVKIDQFEFIGVAKQHGFSFHHTNEDSLMLQGWIPNSKNRLPHYATHYVGVGGLVIDFDTGKVLLIKEKQGHDTFSWKIPGGLVDVGEYVSEAAIREVKEETGIDACFRGVISLREKKEYYFGRNDIYFVVLLEAKSKEINACEIEVANCQWMDVEEWALQTFLIETQKLICDMSRQLVKDRKEENAVSHAALLLGRHVEIDLPTLKATHFMYVPNYLK